MKALRLLLFLTYALLCTCHLIPLNGTIAFEIPPESVPSDLAFFPNSSQLLITIDSTYTSDRATTSYVLGIDGSGSKIAWDYTLPYACSSTLYPTTSSIVLLCVLRNPADADPTAAFYEFALVNNTCSLRRALQIPSDQGYGKNYGCNARNNIVAHVRRPSWNWNLPASKAGDLSPLFFFLQSSHCY
jgi:hypothetical protein